MTTPSQHARPRSRVPAPATTRKNTFGFSNPWGLAFWLAVLVVVATVGALLFVMPVPTGVLSALAVWCVHFFLPSLLGFLVWRLATGEAVAGAPSLVIALAVRTPLLYPVWKAAHGGFQLAVEMSFWLVGVVMVYAWLQTLNKLSGK